MADNFIGEIRSFAFGVLPSGWIPCDGRLLQITSNAALYTLLGTAFGGDGRNNFAVPDLRGRCIMHPDAATPRGTAAGAEKVTLEIKHMPPHAHSLNAAGQASPICQGTLQCTSATATEPTPVNNANAGITARSAKARFNSNDPDTTMLAGSVTLSGSTDIGGGGAPHVNMSPYLVINFCIATAGLYPTRSQS